MTMRKIRLRIDTLAVESFPTAHAQPGAGTVAGAEFTAATVQCGSCGGETCAGFSCYTSCAGAVGRPACTCPIHYSDPDCVV
jgi:hypothetical protein